MSRSTALLRNKEMHMPFEPARSAIRMSMTPNPPQKILRL
jgi:hypothetical protein